MNYWYFYLLELKYRISLILISWFSIIFVCYFYKEILLFLFVSFSNYASLSESKPYFIFTDVTEIFSVYIQLTFFIANQIILAQLFYNILIFLSTSLYEFEYINLKFVFKTLILSWIASTFFLNKIIVPLSWQFFLSFHKQQTNLPAVSLFFEAKLNEYFNYYINLYFVCLINCQLFILLILFLNNLNKDLNQIKTFRKIFYFTFVVFSTLTTPPDVLSQLLLSFVLIIIYEILIFLKIYSKINLVTN